MRIDGVVAVYSRVKRSDRIGDGIQAVEQTIRRCLLTLMDHQTIDVKGEKVVAGGIVRVIAAVTRN